MFRRNLLAAALALLAAPVLAQTTAPQGSPVLEIDVAGEANGTIRIALRPDLAPLHVARVIELAESGAYDNVVFHRVIEGFMAQTGDVEFGKHGGDTARAGMGGSSMPDLPAEFNDVSFQAGTVGMARSQDPDSANSQFFIDLAPATFLDGQYTVVGQLVHGWEVLNAIKKGDPAANGAVVEPDHMLKVTVEE